MIIVIFVFQNTYHDTYIQYYRNDLHRMPGESSGLIVKNNRVQHVDINLAKGEATIDMKKHIAREVLKEALKDYPKYQLSEAYYQQPIASPLIAEKKETKSWFATYKPILLIFGYIEGISLLIEYRHGAFN